MPVDGVGERDELAAAGSAMLEEPVDHPVSYTHLTLPTNREV